MRGIKCYFLYVCIAVFQCFDYRTYIRNNYTNPTWKCPVCRERTPEEDLELDMHVQRALRIAYDVQNAFTEIRFNETGGWLPERKLILLTDQGNV